MILLPIRTEAVSRRTPTVNYVIIGINLLAYLVLDERLAGPAIGEFKKKILYLDSTSPAIYQFLTYQFLHADIWHLFGNLIFLWVFGNGVNGKMGNWPYLLFYLAGGVFAAWAHVMLTPGPIRLVGASGAIAAVTTAYLVLFPRARVTILLWFFFIHFFEVSAMLVICLKIIVWDNIISPTLSGQGSIAYHAHLAGYLFGFVGTLGMLLLRALPRDHFDILALWKRWNQRREFSAAMSDPKARARAELGTAARAPQADPQQRDAESRHLDQISDLRTRITEAMNQEDVAEAATLYQQLVTIDPKQCLSERLQLDLARKFYTSGRFPQAAAAFERYLESYPHSTELNNVRLLLGIIFARDLRQYESADEHLTQTLEHLRDDKRRTQCLQWLQDVRAALGRPAPEQ